jgi:hypothetical protein
MSAKGGDKGKAPADDQHGGHSESASNASGRSTPAERPGSRLGSIGPQKFTLGGVEKVFAPREGMACCRLRGWRWGGGGEQESSFHGML